MRHPMQGLELETIIDSGDNILVDTTNHMDVIHKLFRENIALRAKVAEYGATIDRLTRRIQEGE